MSDGPADNRQLIFISYGRADGLDFATRLAEDLEREGGCRVWIDWKAIEKGEPFEIAIERGIHQSSIVAAVMTRRSLAEDSVCRDEVVFALNASRPSREIGLALLADWETQTGGAAAGDDVSLIVVRAPLADSPRLPTSTP